MSKRAQALQALFDAHVFKDGTVGRDFWCADCQRWTSPELLGPDEVLVVAEGGWQEPTCGVCGETYKCQECGHEIDTAGNCLREEGHDA